MKENILKLFKSGFISIIVSNTLVKLLVFASSIFLPRFLDVDAFGMYTYTENIFNYFLIINGIGISNSVLKFCSNTESTEKHKGYMNYILKIGLIFDLFLIVVMFLFTMIFRFNFSQSYKLFRLMLFIPILSFVFECIQLYLRSEFENTKYSFLTFSYSFLFLILQIFFAIYFSITGVIFAKYISLIISVFLGFYFLYKIQFFKIKRSYINNQRKKEILMYGITMLAGNFASMIITLNDTQIFSNFIKDPISIAMYKVGSLPLQIMLFFTNSIIIFIIPIFVKHVNDKHWIKKNYRKTMLINFVICAIIHIVFFIFSKFFILLFYGSKYLNSLQYLNRFLCVSFVLSTIRNIPGNLLAVLGYEKYNLLINVVTVMLHFVLQIVFVKIFGIYAIGIALFISYLASGLLLFYKMYKVTKINN